MKLLKRRGAGVSYEGDRYVGSESTSLDREQRKHYYWYLMSITIGIEVAVSGE